MKQKDYKNLLAAAKDAASKSYSPYSQYPVGAAVLTEDGQVFTGCNIENKTIGAGICAERVTLGKAISEGHRRFEAVAVACIKGKESWPCGFCRQFISEFGSDIDIIVESQAGELIILTAGELLPEGAASKISD